jgi:hypothetical protein
MRSALPPPAVLAAIAFICALPACVLAQTAATDTLVLTSGERRPGRVTAVDAGSLTVEVQIAPGQPMDLGHIARRLRDREKWYATFPDFCADFRAMFANDPLKLRHDMQISNWQVDAVHAPDTFASTKAQAAARIPFAKPVAVAPPPGSKAAAKPAAKKPPATTKTGRLRASAVRVIKAADR